MNRFRQDKKIFRVYLSDGSSFDVEAISTRKAEEMVRRKCPRGIEVEDVEEIDSSDKIFFRD